MIAPSLFSSAYLHKFLVIHHFFCKRKKNTITYSKDTTKVTIFWLENGKFEFSRKQYIFLKHSKREFCAEFYYHF